MTVASLDSLQGDLPCVIVSAVRSWLVAKGGLVLIPGIRGGASAATTGSSVVPAT